MKKISLPKLKAMVDELGALNAKQAELKKASDAIKKSLVASGHPAIEGLLFRAAIVEADRVSIDAAAVKAMLSAAQLAKVQKVSKSISVRVSARNGALLEAAA